MFFGERSTKYFRPVKLGCQYRVCGHWTGDFVGEVESVRRDTALVRIVDPLRPAPRVTNKCCYPECVREDFHAGEHEFQSVRKGALLEIAWASAKFSEAAA